VSYGDAVNAPLSERTAEALRNRLLAPDAPRRTVRRRGELTSHPHFVMESDSEIRAWTEEDTERLQESIRRTLWSVEMAKRAHARVMWISNVGDA
jgi:hypothetical protein